MMMEDSKTDQENRRRRRWTLHPAMGLRLSPADVALLVVGGLLAWGLWKPLGQAALLPLVVLGHFFLFCNVFRIGRKLELTWAGVFIVNLAAWSLLSTLNWLGILAIQTPLTVGLIIYEIFQPYYHGVGSVYLKQRREKMKKGASEGKTEALLVPGRIKIGLYIGDICTAPADVIAVSTNPHLELMAGTGGAVRDLGGWGIQEECKAIIEQTVEQTGHRYLMPGSVVMTGAGRLPHQGVLMCVAIDPFHHSTVAVIAQCTGGALDLAARQCPAARTVALPVFAAGNGRFDFVTALETMLNTIVRHEAGDIKLCRIVVFEPAQIRMARELMQRRLGTFEIIVQESGNGLSEKQDERP